MGQKINPNIFRLGVNKTWKTKFFEKKNYELPIYIFKDLEIKSYIKRFLEIQGILVHDYKQHYSNSTLNLYISYFVLSDFIIKQNNKNAELTVIDKSGVKKTITHTLKSSKKTSSALKKTFSKSTTLSAYKLKNYSKTKSIESSYSSSSFSTFEEKHSSRKVEGILNNLFKVLSLFTNNKFNIIINFCCLNKNLSFLKKIQKKDFILLQKYKTTSFLKEGIELLFHSVHNKNSANLVAKFIAIQIRKIKRHKFFLSFLKQTFTVLLKSNFSKVRGIKIIIKGRLNGVPRAKHKIITIGDVPVQSISANIDYAQTSTHNANGSYGIKVWIVEK